MVSDSGRMSRLGFPLIADNEVFEMLQNAKRGCGNFTPLGSYVTVAFAASMAMLWVVVVLHEVLVQFYNRCCGICISWYTGIWFWAF